MSKSSCLVEFDFSVNIDAGLFIVAGGFEIRATAFTKKLHKARCSFEHSIILRYKSQEEDNRPNFEFLHNYLKNLVGKEPYDVAVDADVPIQSSANIKRMIEKLAEQTENKTAVIDISGMTHLWANYAIHTCVSCGLRTTVVFTEARWYFPQKYNKDKIIRAWKKQEYDGAAAYLQSAGLKSIYISPEFGGSFRSGKPTCLIVFVGYEPNRIVGLVDSYAPGALIVIYGRSPHEELGWRTEFSRALHEQLFSKWHIREIETSTCDVDQILKTLDYEVDIVHEQYDIAIAPQCSKMQALASYLFWRKHPEVQLVFTTPISFNPDHYSKGSNRTFAYTINELID